MDTLKDIYLNSKPVRKDKIEKIEVNCTFIDGPKVEITGQTQEDYTYGVRFYAGNELVHTNEMKINRWCTHFRSYYTDWKIEVELKEHQKIIHTERFDLTGKKVVIEFESKSMGDTLSWMPYVEDFQEKHNCEVYLWTFHSEWFDQDRYPNIHFLEDGESWSNVYAKFSIGLFCGEQPEGNDDFVWDRNKNPRQPFDMPQQEIITDILGLDYVEKTPHLKYDRSPVRDGKYVTIAQHSTAQCKYWNWPNGWNEVVKYLKTMGYDVICIDRDKGYGTSEVFNQEIKGVIDETGNKPLQDRMRLIHNADFHIGTGSGLSWLAWAVGTPTILISSFSKPYTEFQNNIIRLYNDNELSGYYNTGTFDKSNWNWNPIKETNTMNAWHSMETISPIQVKEAIDTISNNSHINSYLMAPLVSDDAGVDVNTGKYTGGLPIEDRQYPDELSWKVPEEKIGMIFMPYNCHKTFPKWAEPWVKAKDKHNLTIAAASNMFKGYADLGFSDESNQETLRMLKNDYKDFIDYVWTGTPRTDAETRNMVLYWLLQQDVDVVWCVDSDEWFTDKEIDYTIDYIRSHSQETFFEMNYRNYLEDNSKYYNYKAGRIYRVKRFESCHFYMDTHMHYDGIQKLYEPTSELGDYRSVLGSDIPREHVHPKHYSWNDDRKDGYQPGNNKDRIEYQKIAYGDGSSWKWNDKKDKVEKTDHSFWNDVDIHDE